MTYNYLRKINKKTQKRLLNYLLENESLFLRSFKRCEFIFKETPNYMIAFIDEEDYRKALKVLNEICN